MPDARSVVIRSRLPTEPIEVSVSLDADADPTISRTITPQMDERQLTALVEMERGVEQTRREKSERIRTQPGVTDDTVVTREGT